MGRGAPEAGRQLLHRQPLGVADPWHRFGDPRQSIRFIAQPMMTEREFRNHHERAAARLRSVAANATTSCVNARLNAQAEEHEQLARQLDELDAAG